MDPILVLARDTEAGEETLHAAGQHAAGIDAKLFVLSVVDEDEYRSTLQRSSNTRVEEIESVDDLAERAREQAAEQAERTLDDIDVEYEVVSEIAPLPSSVITFAEENDCSQIYVVSEGRTPAGKAIFGDLAQSILLNFDGLVTIRTEKE